MRMTNLGRNSLGRKPDFFKVLIGDFEQRLRIPREFVKYISKESSETAILEGPSGSQWHVKLKRTMGDIYLQDGWEQFSRDHSLRFGEFLVFRYCGNMHFSVKIFGGSACEREDAFMVKSSHESTNCHGHKRRGRPPKNRERNKRVRPCNSPEPCQRIHHSEKHEKDCILGQKHPHLSDQSDSLRGQRGSLPKPLSPIPKGMNVKQAAYSFTSTFPYFVIKMKAYNVQHTFNLNIPASFSRVHLPNVSTKMALWNIDGNAWMVNFRITLSRNMFCGGWQSFSCENDLKKGDFCVFELVDKLEMRVHIFRVGSQNSCCSAHFVDEIHNCGTGNEPRVYATRRSVSLAPSRTLL